MPPTYPAHWEADVVLRDGRPAHVRPIRPQDGPALREFHGRLSDRTIYLRYFAPHPHLSDDDLERLTVVDHGDRVALVVTQLGEIIAVGRFDRLGEPGTRDHDAAEVAFVVRDDHQGRGIGSLLLEHLAAVGRECGIRRFVADVLPQNTRMIATFTEAGYSVRREFEEGVLELAFDIESTADLRRVMEAREHRYEAASLARVLHPRSVAVVGASRTPGTIGHALLHHVTGAGFPGMVYAVNPEARQILGVTCVDRLDALGADDPVDLALVAVRPEALPDVIDQAARVGVRGLVAVGDGFPHDPPRQRHLARQAREAGIRLIGPSAFGVITTDPRVRLNASLAPVMPAEGRIGFFCQSGAMGVDILARLDRRGLGVSSFVSAGDRADVSGNDLLQYWEEDSDTDIVLMYLESIGNPAKFARLARRVARRKPVVVLRTTGATLSHPLGHEVPASGLSPAAIDMILAEAGIIETHSLDQLIDVAEVLTFRGLLDGNRLAVVGNSDALSVLTRNAAEQVGLSVPVPTRTVSRASSPDTYRRLLDDAGRDPSVDAIVALHVPPIEGREDGRVREVIATCASSISKPLVAVVVGWTAQDLRQAATAYRGVRSIPVFTDVEHAVSALGGIARYAQFRARPTSDLVEVQGVAAPAARRAIDAWIAHAGVGIGDSVAASDTLAAEVLANYGISVWPNTRVATVDEAVAAAEDIGWPVALKNLDPAWVHRLDLGGVRLDLRDADDLRAAFVSMEREAKVRGSVAPQWAVQRMAGRGVPCSIRGTADPLVGPVVSFGLGGPVAAALDDRAYAIPPIDADAAARLVAAPRSAGLLSAHGGAPAVDREALIDLVRRVGALIFDQADVHEVAIDPVLVDDDGVRVLGARLVVGPTSAARDSRRLTTWPMVAAPRP